MQEVAITSFGLNKWGKYPDKTVEELAHEAVTDALKDAGMQWKDIEYIVGGIDPYLGLPGQVAGSVFQGKMGYQGIPSTSVFNACATGAYARDIGLAPFATQSEISITCTPEEQERQHEKQICQGSLEQAGIGPEDLDLVECYDLSTAMELDWMEDIGICGEGEAEKLLHDGDTTVGGRIPVNPSGGVSAFGESVPAQALVQVCELVMQLRGVAGKRQVEGAKTGFAVNKGLFHSISSVIVTR